MPLEFGSQPAVWHDEAKRTAYLAECQREEAAARQRRQAAELAEQQQQTAQHEAARLAAMQAAIAQYKAQAREVFPGSAAEFDRAWPQLLADYQRRQVAQALSDQQALLDRKRALYASMP